MANRRTTRTATSPSGTGRGRNRGVPPRGTAPVNAPAQPSGGRYRRTGWAFLILALAAVLALREWFGISGAAGSFLHHIAAGPVGVLGLLVPLLLAALGVAMLRVHSLGAVHARVSVGCLGLLTALTGMIQVVLDMPEVMAVEVASLAQALQQCEDTALAHEVLQRVLVSARRGRRRLDMHPARKKEESAPVPEEVSHAKVATGT